MAAPTLFFDDFTPGTVFDLGTYEVTEEEIICFGRRFDPQYFHIDPEAARLSPFGGLIASGWHTCSIWARLWVDAIASRADSRGSPGMQEVRWPAPVRPGTRLTGTVEILDAVASSRRADRGTVIIGCTMTDHDGAVVLRARGRAMFGRRHRAAAPDATAPAAVAASDATAPAAVAASDATAPAAVEAPDATARDAAGVRSRDGVRLNLALIGGSGPDLLVCHATGFHGLAYRPLCLDLRERFRVWTVDFRGHGSSDAAPGDDYSWQGMGSDVEACAEAVGAERLYGFGHSMGGAALLLAEESRPGTFAGLFLYEPVVPPSGLFDEPHDNPLAMAARNRREVFSSRAEALARYSRRSPLGVLRADALAAYVEAGFVDLEDGRVRLACRPETEAKTFEASGSLPLDRVAGIDVAATVAAGSVPGRLDPAALAPAVAESLPQGRFLRCEGLGHLGPLESPATLAAETIRALLGE